MQSLKIVIRNIFRVKISSTWEGIHGNPRERIGIEDYHWDDNIRGKIGYMGTLGRIPHAIKKYKPFSHGSKP